MSANVPAAPALKVPTDAFVFPIAIARGLEHLLAAMFGLGLNRVRRRDRRAFRKMRGNLYPIGAFASHSFPQLPNCLSVPISGLEDGDAR